MAFPQLPTLRRLPTWVDPDQWLQAVHNSCYKRRVDRNGSVKMGKHRYYLNRALKGRYVVIRVNSLDQKLIVELEGQSVKAMGIKGLYGGILEFCDYLEFIGEEARAELRQWCYQHRCKTFTM